MASYATSTLLSPLKNTIALLVKDFVKIPEERKLTLQQFSKFINSRINQGEKLYLNFICTHNSRRSHISQLWAQAAACHYHIEDIVCFSGGTEATAFNPRAVKAMKDAGFNIVRIKEGENPIYSVIFSDDVQPIKVFSKKYDDPFNKSKSFVAIMTCSHADENCPLVIGASARFLISYNDPKDYDGTPEEEEKYKERVHEIGREMLYAFSLIN